MPLRRLRQSALLLCLPVAGCVIYQPAAQDPAKLAIIEEVAFPVAASPALTGGFLVASQGQLHFGVNGIDGATRIFLPGHGPLKVDAGTRKLSIVCSVSFSNFSREIASVDYTGSTHMVCTLEPEMEYVLKGRMVGPDVSYGVEAWIEERATGAITHPVTFMYMRQSIQESEQK